MSLLKQYLSMENNQETAVLVAPTPVPVEESAPVVQEQEPVVTIAEPTEAITVEPVVEVAPVVATEETKEETPAEVPVDIEVVVEPVVAEEVKDGEHEVVVEVPAEVAADVEVETEVKKDGTTVIEIEIPAVVPVTEEEEEAATVTLEDIEAEFRELQEEQAPFEPLVDEVDVEVTSMEAYIEVLKHGLEHKEFSPQFAGITCVALERYVELFGADVVAVPALEDYAGKEKLEAYYTLSLESFRGFLQRIVNVVPNFLKNTFTGVINGSLQKKRAAAAEAIIASADAVIAKIEKADDKEVSLGGFDKKLSMGGKAPSSVIGAVKTDLSTTSELLSSFIPAQLDYVTKIGEAVGKAIYSGGKGKTAVYMEEILKLPHPASKLKPTVTTGSGLIGHVVVAVPDLKFADDKLSVNVKELATAKGATLVKSKEKVQAVGTVKLTRKEALDLAKAAKAYAVVIKQANDKLTAEMKTFHSRITKILPGPTDILSNKALLAARGASWEEDKALDYAVTADFKQVGALLKFTDAVFNHAIVSAQTALAVAKKLK